MSNDQNEPAAAPDAAPRVPRGVRQARLRAALAGQGVHLHSRRNPQRCPAAAPEGAPS